MTDELFDLEALADHHGQALLSYAYLTCRDLQLAQDAVQAALCKLAEKASTDPIREPLPYLRRMVTNQLISAMRRKAVLNRLMPRLAEPHSVIDHADQIVDRLAIWRALETLSARQRSALVLRYYECLSDAEIAEALDCAPATVRSLVSRALRHLRTELDEVEAPRGEPRQP